jgi:hypothetical protein
VDERLGEPLVIPSSGFLRTWCDRLGNVGEAAPEAHLVTGLGVVSAMAAPKLRITFGKSVEFCHVWQLIVGQSALGAKTSTLQSSRAAIERARAGDPFRGIEGLGDEVRFDYLTRATDAGIVELLGAPTEEQAKEWADMPPSWLLAWNEVSTLFTKDAARWEESSRRVLLSVYDGYVGSHTKATKAHATRCSVTMIGNIPPHVLGGAVSELMFSSGFAGRWLVMETPPLARAVPFPAPASAFGWDAIEAQVDELTRVVRSTVNPVEHVLDCMDPQAAAAYCDWYDRNWHRHNSASDESGHRAAEVWGRARTTAQKVAALGALARTCEGLRDLHDLRIEEEDVAWALGLVDRSLSYWDPLIEESNTAADPDVEALLRFARKVGADDADTGVTLRQFMLATKSNGRVRLTAKRAKDAVRSAADAGLLDYAEDGRRSVRFWAIEGS